MPETGKLVFWPFAPMIVNLTTVVVLSNLTIAFSCLGLTVGIARLRRQLIAMTECCDRQTISCGAIFSNAPVTMQQSRVEIRNLRRFYRQQLVTIDRIQTIGLLIGFVRSVVRR